MAPSQLQVKVNALKRLLKEEKYYKGDLADNEQEVARLQQAKADEYDIKKQSQIVDESKRMIQEVARLIETHKVGLREFLEGYDGDDKQEALELLK